MAVGPRSFVVLEILLNYAPGHADKFDVVCDVRSEHWQADPQPIQPLQQWYVYFPNTTSGYEADHVHSTSLVDHGEACSEWNLFC